MKFAPHTRNLPFQTKLLFTFIIVLALALVTKWLFLSFFKAGPAHADDSQLASIKLQIKNVCLSEESKNIKATAETNEDDQDWLNFKAPEYCKCMASHIVSSWDGGGKLSSLSSLNNDELPKVILSQLKDDTNKKIVDLCLSMAQKANVHKVTGSAAKN